MPNWVHNTLEITGDTEHVHEVIEAIKGEPEADGTLNKIDFDKIIPVPEELSDYEGSHKWLCDNWGTTKYFNWSSEGDAANEIHFDTALVPSLPIIIKLSTTFPKVSLNFSYLDVGRCQEGKFLIKNGQIVEESCWEMKLWDAITGEEVKE